MKGPKNILIPIYGNTGGGIASVIRQHLILYKQENINVVFLSLASGTFSSELEDSGYQVKYFNELNSCDIPILLDNSINAIKNFAKIHRLRKRIEVILGESSFDIIHAHKISFSYILGPFSRKHGIPLVVALHTMPNKKASFWRLRQRLATFFFNNYCSYVYAVADVLLQEYKAGLKIENGVIHNSITKIERNIGYRAELCQGLSYTPSLIIGFIGRIKEAKGIHILIEAAATLVKKYPKIHFLIAGEAGNESQISYLYRLRQQVKNAKLEKYVTLAGRMNVEDYLGAVDIACNPSFSEVCPMSVIEAFSAKVPVVATTVGGTPEIIEDKVNGLLVEKENSVVLVLALTLYVDNRQLRQRMVANAYKKLERVFSFKAWKEQHIKVYEKLLLKP